MMLFLLIYLLDEDGEDGHFEESLDKYVDWGKSFLKDNEFDSRVDLVGWAKEEAIKYNIYLVII